MIKKVLIANRGEIAVRIIRACKELNIATVAVYSQADKDALHVQLADEAYCIGPNAPKDSYLSYTNMISVATLTGCDAIHPGYGFLSENADFAEMCEECNIKFIGPTSEAISKMGIKDVAKQTMRDADVPVVPGSNGIIDTVEDGVKVAKDIGYPVLIKATAGGGGKGIRVAKNEEELRHGIAITQQEADTSFGNSGVYIEKYIENFRHVEIQVLADEHGQVIHLGERDCTIQRRLQKLLEESPSPALNEAKRREMGAAAVRAARAVSYRGAGTIEFIYEPDGSFYFMEMNTRIQVEHGVTEEVTGVDLVKEQIRIAAGEPLSISQEDVQLTGHAIECRINAEDSEKNFMPSCGRVETYLAPGGPGVRIDSAVYQGYFIPPYYDSMVSKVIAYGKTREDAIATMKRALDEYVIEGIKTTIPFHTRLLKHPVFQSGQFNTKFLQKYPLNEQS
ncbi:acetyl-CoA carboxylase biotin carboxylase subunit [Sporolactobacillus inulinus]|jgi:acetyl-CoA carboxylase biotin carboxylase subunit|uniref:Biotin carboxylase n=2 Tax=Sporolactobacillus inulinus TaxID=2078 RepID=A0A4Y1Z822_9BACL|nr:acetyl-CoA carboxylase biotin carboxylase subunit [Sporolactobacillus inulinus]KLI03645.1 acetyl-CoA carboxylase [Sporolactobacillus inulinus CASD]GAY75179.1 biotin carboxylase of acetyl-CoA carboxylase [Sporolactobacillus inulinus]GEB76495.1 acetyl-CoA carboxylase biotin carboxylase subunit [Sporolactobacillus inulinus]